MKVSGIASGNKLIKTIRYPHMWRYSFTCEDIDDFGDIKFVSYIVLNLVGVSSKHLRVFLESLRQSSAILGPLRKFSEILGKCSETFVWPSSEIFGKWSEIFGKSSKTPSWTLRKTGRQWQRERHQTKALMSRTIPMHVRYNSWYISLPSSAEQEREMTKLCVVWRTWARAANFS